MDTKQQMLILQLESEIDSLKKKLFFSEKKVRELEREIADYTIREKQLLEELDEYETKYPSISPVGGLNTQGGTNISAEDFHSLFDAKTKPIKEGMEKDWGELMYAYTDQIFVDADQPDLLLYRDDSGRCYSTPTGNTHIYFPITQKTLDRANIIKVRPLTDEETQLIIEEFNL